MKTQKSVLWSARSQPRHVLHSSRDERVRHVYACSLTSSMTWNPTKYWNLGMQSTHNDTAWRKITTTSNSPIWALQTLAPTPREGLFVKLAFEPGLITKEKGVMGQWRRGCGPRQACECSYTLPFLRWTLYTCIECYADIFSMDPNYSRGCVMCYSKQ